MPFENKNHGFRKSFQITFHHSTPACKFGPLDVNVHHKKNLCLNNFIENKNVSSTLKWEISKLTQHYNQNKIGKTVVLVFCLAVNSKICLAICMVCTAKQIHHKIVRTLTMATKVSIFSWTICVFLHFESFPTKRLPFYLKPTRRHKLSKGSIKSNLGN